MEGLIPFVYRAIVHYKNDKEGPIGSWLSESPSYSYMRLPGDSGRFQSSSASSTSSMSNNASATTQVMVASSGVQSPRRRFTPRRLSTGQAL